MEVPRRLYTTETGEICEEGDPRARFLLSAKGGVMTEAEAHRVGLLDYLARRSATDEPPPTLTPEEVSEAPEVKMVEQAEVEDKAVSGPTEEKGTEEPEPAPETDPPADAGVIVPPETRRSSTRRQGA